MPIPEEHIDHAGLSPWNTRLIDVITDCEDDLCRYRGLIASIKGNHACNARVLSCCMENTDAHKHLAILTALGIVDARLEKAGFCRSAVTGKKDASVQTLRGHIRLIHAMMLVMIDQVADGLTRNETTWRYSDSLLATLLDEQLHAAMDIAIAVLHKQFSCTLVTVIKAAIEPAMKSVQDRLSLKPELPLNRKAFAGTLLGLKAGYRYGQMFTLDDLATDLSQLFNIPRTICLSD